TPALDPGAVPPGAATPAGPTGGPATGVHALRPAHRAAPADWGPQRPRIPDPRQAGPGAPAPAHQPPYAATPPHEEHDQPPHQPPSPSRSRNPRP
ncbi:hypothetical protein ACWIGE_25335, partial [Streptomyces diastaticus]